VCVVLFVCVSFIMMVMKSLICAQLVFSSTEVLDVSADYFENIKDQHLLSRVVEGNPRWFQHPSNVFKVSATMSGWISSLEFIRVN
jgi:hypothetical protein